LIGVNLLREGLDLPEVSLVAILDADKEGFLRNERSLVQTVGRAARNLNGMVIMYADKMTNSMQKTIDETLRRRELQDAYNKENGLVPTALNKSKEKIIDSTQVADGDQAMRQLRYEQSETVPLAAEEAPQYSDSEELRKQIKVTKKAMESAAKELDFIEAARLRDRLFGLEKQVKKMKNNKLIKQFRIVAILEGFSWIALLITMILKYKFEISYPNKIVGLIHGLFFLLFCGYILLFLIKEKWAFSKALILFIAAFLPFGTFWAAKKYLK